MNTKKLTILMDNREPKWLQTLLKEDYPSINFVVKTLITGDFESPSCIIERKSISDLWSSLNDGRFHTQLNRMTTYQNEKVVIYLITGSIDEWLYKMNKIGIKVNEDMIHGAITSLLVRHNIRVICDSHEKAALKRMIKIIRKIEEDEILDLPSLRNPDTLMAKYLNISLNEFIELKNTYGSSLCNLCKLTEKDFMCIKGIGKIKSKKIINILKYGT